MKTNWKTGIIALASFATLTPMSSALADQLYYNASNGAAAVGVIDNSSNFTTIKTYSSGTFSTGWTQIVNTPKGIIFYNAKNGAGAVAVIDNSGNITTIKTYSPGTFSTGWTNIISE